MEKFGLFGIEKENTENFSVVTNTVDTIKADISYIYKSIGCCGFYCIFIIFLVFFRN
jgi:hypothetical protein